VLASARRRSFVWTSALVLFCAGAVAVPAGREYQTVDVDLLRITIDTDWGPRTAPGYFPARFEITNVGELREIEIVAVGSRFYAGTRSTTGSGSTTVRQTLRLAMGDKVRLTMPVPIYGNTENLRFEIRERNRVIQRFNYFGFTSRMTPRDASVLVVAAPGTPVAGIGLRTAGRGSAAGARGGGGGAASGGLVGGVFTGGGPGGVMDFMLEPARLPTNWLGYTSLRAVVLGPVEWDQFTDAQKGALLAWVGGGGDLIFVDGEITTLLPGARTEAAAGPDRLIARHLLGRVHALPLQTLTSTGLTTLLLAMETNRELFFALPANVAPDWGNVEKRGFRLTIPGIQGVPARAFLLILILFAILIGPVNYWLLKRKGQQVLVVLTVPVISTAFIILLGGYAVAGEGFRVQGRASTFTILDQNTKQAATRSTVSVYAAGLTPSGGLRFGRDVAVYAVGPEGTGVRDRMEMNLSEAQHFSDGVLQARAPTNFEQILVRAARERLSFSPENGGLSVTNGLEARLIALQYRDGDTIYRLDGELAAGDKNTMKGTGFNLATAVPEGITIPAKLGDLFQNQPSGSYIAVLDHSPFWETGVAKLSERGSLHVVLGWPEGQK